MSGRALTRDMQQLMLKHGLTLSAPEFIRPADPVDHIICVEGIASTSAVDAERVKFSPGALTWSTLPALLFDHNVPAGSVDDLHYEAGKLLVTCTVTHSRARRCSAFSIGCKVREYQIRNAATPDFFAEITRAELTEVSLVDTPVNAECRVLKRSRVSAHSEFYHLIGAKVTCLQKLMPLIQQEQRS